MITVCFVPLQETQIFVLYFKMFRGHNNIVYGSIHNFLNKNGLYKIFVMSLDFAEIINYRKHVDLDDIQGALSPSTAATRDDPKVLIVTV